MHLNNLGSWAVVWIVSGPHGNMLSTAFFANRDYAITFRDSVGGELYMKHPDGSLKRSG